MQEAKIIGADHHWTGGKSILVQTGDVVDRGPQSRKALDLLRQLEDEAEAAGGQVFALIGDHEAMRTQKYVRDSSAEEAAEFAGLESEKARQRYYYAAVDAAQAAVIRDRKPFDEDDFEKGLPRVHAARLGRDAGRPSSRMASNTATGSGA